MNTEIFWSSFLSISVFIAALRNYLTVSRIWKRKAIVSVTESISVAANLMFLTTAIPFFLYFAIAKKDSLAAMNTGMGILVSLIFIVIGSGAWIATSRQRNFFERMRKALMLEKGEAGELLNPIIHSRGSEEILVLLTTVAMIDGEYHDEERQIVERFAKANDLRVDYIKQPDGNEVPSLHGELEDLSRLVGNYLKHDPPRDQIGEFTDLVQILVTSDKNVHEKEKSLVAEILGMTDHYLSEQYEPGEMFEVLVAPQSPQDWPKAQALLSDASYHERDGGKVLSAGTYHSRDYAGQVAEKFHRAGILALITTVSAFHDA